MQGTRPGCAEPPQDQHRKVSRGMPMNSARNAPELTHIKIRAAGRPQATRWYQSIERPAPASISTAASRASRAETSVSFFSTLRRELSVS